MKSNSGSKWLCAAALLGAACTSEPQLVASNCDKPEDCLRSEALKVDAVDILVVVDDSPSIEGEAALLKAQLPRLLGAITSGETEDMSFPPAKSVHIAVTTTDLGGAPGNADRCTGDGQDGVFIQPGQLGVTCDDSFPDYVSYDADAAATSAAQSASCVPLAVPGEGSEWDPGCAFEQPLEAALKSVWPSEDTSLMFNSGSAHGSGENAGFLRDNSVLVVLVLTDEDDCSAADRNILKHLNPSNEYQDEPPNLRCYLHSDKLYATERYVDHFKRLRPNNDNVIFAVVGGVPAELVSEEFRSRYDFAVPADTDRYFADVLAASDMQETTVDADQSTGRIRPSCTGTYAGSEHSATPPRRLVEVARAFGAQGVLGSICAEDFGDTTGQIIRRVAERLTAASEH